MTASTLNRVAYLRLKASWQRANRLSALSTTAVLRAFACSSGLLARPRLLAIRGLLLLVAGRGGWQLWRGREQVFATAVGRTQSVRLADGSRMELNTNTRVRTDVTAARRVVMLDSGEAYFDVVHDAARPFVVYAGNRRITDLGTKFSVFRNGDDVRVTVREGRVKVDVLDPPWTPVVAEAGHTVMARAAEPGLCQARHRYHQRLAGAAACWCSISRRWRRRPISSTVTTAADRHRGNARRIRIGGSFKADNVGLRPLAARLRLVRRQPRHKDRGLR